MRGGPEPSGGCCLPPAGWSLEFHRALFAMGYFPMATPGSVVRGTGPEGLGIGEVDWFAADPRAVLPLREQEGLHVPRSVARVLRSGRFVFTSDRAFGCVIRACAEPRRAGDEPWIDAQIVGMYEALHAAGDAHSIEAWRRDPESGGAVLVGGVYGLALGRVFYAESMFTRPRPRLADGSADPLDGSGASSACLVVLCRHLVACGFALLDVQVGNVHTERFGVVEVPMEAFNRRASALAKGRSVWRGLADWGWGCGELPRDAGEA